LKERGRKPRPEKWASSSDTAETLADINRHKAFAVVSRSHRGLLIAIVNRDSFYQISSRAGRIEERGLVLQALV